MWDQGGLGAHLYLRHVLLAPGYSSTAPPIRLLYRETQAWAGRYGQNVGDLILDKYIKENDQFSGNSIYKLSIL